MLNSSDLHHNDYFMYNKNFKRRNTNIIKRLKNEKEISVDAHNWIKARRKIPSRQSCLVVVVLPENDKYCTKHHRAQQRYPNPEHQGKYFLPFLSTAMNKSSKYVKFHMISVDDYKNLKAIAVKGIPVGPSGALFDDYILQNCPSHSIELLCIDNLASDSKIKDFQSCIKVFAGGAASNIVDESFENIQLYNSDSIAHYKFCDSNEYYAHIPLSMGFFDSSFHKLKIKAEDVKLFRSKYLNVLRNCWKIVGKLSENYPNNYFVVVFIMIIL